MENFLLYLKYSNLTLLGLMGLFLYVKYRIEPRVKFVLFFLVCAISFVFGYDIIQLDLNFFIKWFFYFGVTLNTYTFYLITNLFFVFNFKLSRRDFYLFFFKILTALISFIPGKFFLYDSSKIGLNELMFFIPDFLLATYFVFSAIYASFKSMDDDLLVKRIKISEIQSYALGVFIYSGMFLLILARQIQSHFYIELVSNIGLFLIEIFYFLYSIELKKGFLSGKLRILKEEEEKKELEFNPELHEKLIYLLEEEKVYKLEEVSIRMIASKLGEHEYKIRKLINYQLGYKNFNEFINYYRINEITKILSDEKILTEKISITRIAMDFGYGSLASFYRAFKSQKGMTPTEYRDKNLLNSTKN